MPIADDPERSGLRLIGTIPNPFNARTAFQIFMPAAGHMRLAVYDLRGRLVQTLHEGTAAAGHHSLSWDGTSAQGRLMGSGVYIVTLADGTGYSSTKFSLMK